MTADVLKPVAESISWQGNNCVSSEYDGLACGELPAKIKSGLISVICG